MRKLGSAPAIAGAVLFRNSALIEPIASTDLAAVLALNNANAEALSWVTMDQLAVLIEQAAHACRIGNLDAFMIAFDERAKYESPNFLWFGANYRRFTYVDRIVVAPHARGRGLARALYEHLFVAAREAGHTMVCCEVNAEPPNPESDAFHQRMGFLEVGMATIHGGAKSVRYFVRQIS